MSGDETFNITVESEVDLTVDEIWPDGDAPENPTSEDVKAVLEASGPRHRVLNDWGLDDFSVTVYSRKGGHAQVWL